MREQFIYEDSPAKGLVEFSYLAIDDKIIVDKSKIVEDEDGYKYLETHGGQYESHLWSQWNDKDDKIIVTMLLNYHDSSTWSDSLNEQLVQLENRGLYDALQDNIVDMYLDAFRNAGFTGTYISQLLVNANNATETVYWRTVDFQMHEADKDNIHPGYDT